MNTHLKVENAVLSFESGRIMIHATKLEINSESPSVDFPSLMGVLGAASQSSLAAASEQVEAHLIEPQEPKPEPVEAQTELGEMYDEPGEAATAEESPTEPEDSLPEGVKAAPMVSRRVVADEDTVEESAPKAYDPAWQNPDGSVKKISYAEVRALSPEQKKRRERKQTLESYYRRKPFKNGGASETPEMPAKPVSSGWTPERRAAQAERMKQVQRGKSKEDEDLLTPIAPPATTRIDSVIESEPVTTNGYASRPGNSYAQKMQSTPF